MSGKNVGGGNKGGGSSGGNRPAPVHIPRTNPSGGVRTGDSSSSKPAPSPPITKGKGKD